MPIQHVLSRYQTTIEPDAQDNSDPWALISSILGSGSDLCDAEKMLYVCKIYWRGFIQETLTPLSHCRELFAVIFVLPVPLPGVSHATTVIDKDMDTTEKLTTWEAEFALRARIFECATRRPSVTSTLFTCRDILSGCKR